MKKQRSHERRPENTKISISISKKLLIGIDAIAEREHRTRSNLIAKMISDLMEDHPGQLSVAEHAPEYGKKRSVEE